MMPPRDKRTPTDDASTGEEEALHFEPTRTDRIDAPELVSDFVSGGVERDERGQARWIVVPSSRDPNKTFNQLKALDNDALVIEGAKPDEPKPNLKSGYNPYNTGPTKPPVKRR
ncbi:MAG: hypothetical protein ABI640_08125 [Gammaproteobacteria bacterium]